MIDKSLLYEKMKFKKLRYSQENLEKLTPILSRARYESFFASKDMKKYLDNLNIKFIKYPESSQGYPHPDMLLQLMGEQIIQSTIENPDKKVDPVFEPMPIKYWGSNNIEVYVIEAPNNKGGYGPIAYSTWVPIKAGVKPLNVASQIFVYELFRNFGLAKKMLKSIIKKKGLKKVYSESPNEIGRKIIEKVCKTLKCDLEIGYFNIDNHGMYFWNKEEIYNWNKKSELPK